jgi:hypothetical protein
VGAREELCREPSRGFVAANVPRADKASWRSLQSTSAPLTHSLTDWRLIGRNSSWQDAGAARQA